MAKASDNVFPKLIVSSGTAPATPSAGQGKVYEKSSDKKLYFKNEDGTEYDLTSAGSGGGFAAYTGYTPALTAVTTNPTLGTGSTATGRYTQDNKTVHAQFNLTFGTSGTNAGSGGYRISLPVTAAAGPDVFGHGYIYDSSTGLAIPCVFTRVTTTTAQIAYGAGGFVAHGTPFAWAASDQIQGDLVYEAA